MKLVAFSLVLLAGIASASPSSSSSTQAPTLTLSATNKVQAAAGVSAYALGVGSSVSNATGFHSATSFVEGAGSLTTRSASLESAFGDCAPSTSVSGSQLSGNLGVSGYTSVTSQATAQNVSTGAGTGAAESVGLATGNVSGAGVLTYKSFDMAVDGSAFAGALTHATAGTNGVDASSGHTSAAFSSQTNGSLFKFATNTGYGDVKIVNVNLYARAGDLTCSACGASDTTKAVNATIEAGAAGTANTTIVVKP